MSDFSILDCTAHHVERWLRARSYIRALSTLLWFAIVCQVLPRLTTRASARASRYKAWQKAVDLLGAHETMFAGECRFLFCPPWCLFREAADKRVELLPSVCGGFWTAIHDSKDCRNRVRHCVVHYLHWMSTSTYGRYVSVGKVTMTLALLHVLKELNEGFPCSQCFKAMALEDVVFMEFGEEAALFLIHVANALIRPKNAVFHAHPMYGTTLLFHYETSYKSSLKAIKSNFWRPGTRCLRRTFHKQIRLRSSPAPFFSTRYVYSNLTLVIDVDCMRGEQNGENTIQCTGSPSISPLRLSRHQVALTSGRTAELSQPLCCTWKAESYAHRYWCLRGKASRPSQVVLNQESFYKGTLPVSTTNCSAISEWTLGIAL